MCVCVFFQRMCATNNMCMCHLWRDIFNGRTHHPHPDALTPTHTPTTTQPHTKPHANLHQPSFFECRTRKGFFPVEIKIFFEVGPEKMMLEFSESGHPIFPATSPLSRGQLKRKGHGKMSIHYCANLETILTVFRTIISVNQLSLYGAVVEKCEEYETFHDRTGQPVVGGQSSSPFVPSVSKTEVPLDCDDLVRKDLLLQQYGERIEKLSQQDKLSKNCMDAGFLNVVEIGQYFMTEDTAEFSQFTDAVYTLPREEGASEPKGWIRGNTKIGPVLEVATCCLHGMHGVEIRIMPMNKDNSHSWDRISHGSNKLVTNLNNSEQEISKVQFKENALKLDARDFACRSKTKAKPQRRELAGPSTRTIPVGERTWIDVEAGEYVSKKLIHHLRHGNLPRENHGAIEFWKIKDNLQKHFPHCPHWSDDKWKKTMTGGGGNKKRYLYCTDSSGTILYPRALQGHSGRNLIDPTLQDNVRIPNNFFQYIYHVGCAINLHSIINSGLVPGGQNLSNRQTVLFLLVDTMEQNHQDPETIDLNAPRHAQYMHKSWKRHQNTVYWIDINLALKKGLKFYQTRSNAILLHETLTAYCIPKVVRMETGEVIYEKVYASPRSPPKISLKHDWMKELGSEHAQRSEVGKLSRSFQSNRSTPNPDHDRTGQPVVGTDRTGQPVVGTDPRIASSGRKTSHS